MRTEETGEKSSPPELVKMAEALRAALAPGEGKGAE
jgi:hypothetical protein